MHRPKIGRNRVFLEACPDSDRTGRSAVSGLGPRLAHTGRGAVRDMVRPGRRPRLRYRGKSTDHRHCPESLSPRLHSWVLSTSSTVKPVSTSLAMTLTR